MYVSVEAAALGAGKSVAKIVASRWLSARGAGSAASAELIDLIKTGFPDEIMRRKTENQFEALAISIAERLQPYIRHELRGLDDGTREAAVTEVVRTLEAADLSDKALLADDLDPVQLARRVRAALPALEALRPARETAQPQRETTLSAQEAAPPAGDAAEPARETAQPAQGVVLPAQQAAFAAREIEFQLGEAGARLYDVVLDECCDCLAHTLVHLPEFTERAAAESLRRLTTVIAEMETILSRLPAQTLDAPEGDDHDDEFTRRYLASVSENLDRLELFGVRFERLSRPRTTLSVAYISLNVTDENPGEAADRRKEPVTIAEWRQERRARGAVRVERALSEHRLMLIRGEAGSGKSTLLRWLAVTAARGGFTGDLAPLNGHVPFLIKLRSHVGQRLPHPEEFLDDVSPSLAGTMPKAWVHRQMLADRRASARIAPLLPYVSALVLIDGIDEIVEFQREEVRTWLGDLTRTYPCIRVVVTSRPAAAKADWLRDEGFNSAFLEPLSPADLTDLVRHWHAAIRDSGDLPCPPGQLPSYEARLLAWLESAPHLQTLASTPLLAAMLCALNLDRDDLPRDRMSLYAAVIDMLLETRDAKRGIPSAGTVPLQREEKIRLLRDLAWHLSISGRVELAKPTARKLIEERLAAMPLARATGEESLDLLLQRSGIVREPVPGRIDFVHRTIQEYLAAAHAADIGDMDLLIRNAHLDQWRETIVMAAGHGNEPQLRELVRGILLRTSRIRGTRRPLMLLAVACLTTAPSVPDDLRAVLDQCLRELIPPRDSDEAGSLAAVGAPILRLLPENLHGLPGTAAEATVRTVWLINGPEALDVLQRYSSDRRLDVRIELNTAWSYFDPYKYAGQVLAAISPDGGFRVRSQAQLAALGKVAPQSRLILALTHPGDLHPLAAHATSLHGLDLEYESPAHDLATLPELPELRELELGIVGLSDLGFLDSLPRLTNLRIRHCAAIGDYSPLQRSTTLKRLRLVDCSQLRSLDQLPPLGEVVHLTLEGSQLSRGSLAELVRAAPKVRKLNLGHCDWVDDLTPLTELPDLEEIVIPEIAPGTDLSPLAGNKYFTASIADGQDVRDAKILGDRLNRR